VDCEFASRRREAERGESEEYQERGKRGEYNKGGKRERKQWEGIEEEDETMIDHHSIKSRGNQAYPKKSAQLP
jgi:hypothetical protein